MFILDFNDWTVTRRTSLNPVRKMPIFRHLQTGRNWIPPHRKPSWTLFLRLKLLCQMLVSHWTWNEDALLKGRRKTRVGDKRLKDRDEWREEKGCPGRLESTGGGSRRWSRTKCAQSRTTVHLHVAHNGWKLTVSMLWWDHTIILLLSQYISP